MAYSLEIGVAALVAVKLGWECSSEIAHPSNMPEAMGLSLSPIKSII